MHNILPSASVGHSLGGGLALLAYLHMLNDDSYSDLHEALALGGVYTFGCPNVVAGKGGAAAGRVADVVDCFCRMKLKKDR